MNQKGFAHVQLIAIVFTAVLVVGFAGYRIGQHQSSRVDRSGDLDDIATIEGLEILEQEQSQTKKVDIPEEKSEVAEVPQKTESTTPSQPAPKKTEPESQPKKQDKVWLNMTQKSAVQNGSQLNVVSELPKALSGTCNYKLWQEGYQAVYSSSKITSSSTCSGSINVSSLPTYSGWELHVWFDGSDGKTSASQKQTQISLTNPN